MADIWSLMRELIESDEPMAIARNPMVQFGTEQRRYLGATLLPERLVPENEFTEDRIVYFSVVANDGTRYSEPQLKKGELVGSFPVRLGEIDIARQLTGKDFDNIRRVAANNPDAAKRSLINWLNTACNLAMVEKAEAQRWQAMCNAAITVSQLDEEPYQIAISNPEGHRITVPGGTVGNPAGWYETDGTYDPFSDIFKQVTLLADKGYQVSRMIGDTQILSALANNPAVKQQVGTLTINNGALTSRVGLADAASINAYLTGNMGLPPMEIYDATYRTQLGTQFFKPRGSLVLCAATGRTEEFMTGTDGGEFEIVENTLGYYAIGTAVGEDRPGRVIRAESRNLKPVGMYAQGFATALAVIQEPESLAVINVSKPTP